MAVFTDITEPRYARHLKAIENAYAISIVDVEGLVPGTSDSKFVVKVEESDEPLVLTLHETPDVSPMGNNSQDSIQMLRYVNYLSEAVPYVRDRKGQPINAHVVRPLPAMSRNGEPEPYFELSFNGVTKAVSLVMFLRGRYFENSPEEVPTLDEARLAGRALAGYHLAAQSYPSIQNFDEYDFSHFVQEVSRFSDNIDVCRKLGAILPDDRGTDEFSAGRDYLLEMNLAGITLLPLWERARRLRSEIANTIIHGDFYTDNTMFDQQGRFYIFDFNEVRRCSLVMDIGIALNSWASQSGKPRVDNIRFFLEGFDSVIPLTAEVLSQIPLYAQFGAFRWETFRIQRLEMQDPERYTMRSPQELQSLRHAWRELEDLYSRITSVQDLP